MTTRKSDGTVRLVLCCHSIGPYHAARFRALGSRLPDFAVVELASTQSLYSWGAEEGAAYRRLTLFRGSLEEADPASMAAAMRSALDSLAPAAVVAIGYSHRAMRAASRWIRRKGGLSVMATDTWNERRRRTYPLERLKGAWCRWAYDAVFISGQLGAEYFAGLGVPRSQIWRGCSVVDNRYFSERADVARQDAAAERRRLGLPEDYFLCVARFSPEKNQTTLLKAFREYRRRGGAFDLVLVGGGPDRPRLERFVRESSVEGVLFLDWQAYQTVPVLMGLARAFVLPSLVEPWGLVINEAVASGLPVVVSRHCGCYPELCWKGINGWDFDPRDPDELATILTRLSTDRPRLLEMGQASRSLVTAMSPDTWASAVQDILEAGPGGAGGGKEGPMRGARGAVSRAGTSKADGIMRGRSGPDA